MSCSTIYHSTPAFLHAYKRYAYIPVAPAYCPVPAWFNASMDVFNGLQWWYDDPAWGLDAQGGIDTVVNWERPG